MISKTYQAAIDAHNVAIREFHTVRDNYRTLRVGDDEFLAASKLYDIATKAFDDAYDAESARG